MAGEPNTITFTVIGDGRQQPCPLFPNSSGFPALVHQELLEGRPPNAEFTCTYNVELFDWETNVNELIAQFVPEASKPDGSFAMANGNCQTSPKSGDCPDWNNINHKLLNRYCQRTSYFPRGATLKGECPLYLVNPFNPDLPESKGCNKMTNIDSVCSQWYGAITTPGASLYLPTVDNAIKNYCPTVTTPDCACQQADKSVIFKEVEGFGVSGAIRCWWKPCQSASQGSYLIVGTGLPKCTENVCVNVNNVFIDGSRIGGDVINEELNACGNKNPPRAPWYEQWWFWIVVLAVVIILFATLIYFAAQT